MVAGCIWCRHGDSVGEDQLLHVLHGTTTGELRHRSKKERLRTLTAVSYTSASVPSTLPPGRATWPGWARRDLSRVVSRTRSSPAFS